MTAPDPAVGDAPRRPSLRLRLGLLGAATLAVSLGLVGLALDAAYRRSAESGLRQQMETWVYLVLGAAEVGADGAFRIADGLGDPQLGQPGSGVYAHVQGAAGAWNSSSALGVSLPEVARVPAGTTRFLAPDASAGFYRYQYGVEWELGDGRRLPFTVTLLAVPDRVGAQVRAFRRGLWRSLGLAGLLLAGAQFAFLWLGLRPLRAVADEVARVETGEREQLSGDWPREIEPLARNLQRLLDTEKANQARYRNALDSLAHSLKTPLAVLRAQLDNHKDDAVRGAVDDMQHLVATRLQRAAATTRRTLSAPVAVAPLVARLTGALRRVHSQDLRSLEAMIEPGLAFYGEERDLLEVVGNLLENACKHGGGTVALRAGVERGSAAAASKRPGIWIEVRNDGGSVDLEQYMARGARADERVEGQGLGLAIVSEVVSAYGGDMTFDNGTGDETVVRVRIPPT